MHPMALSALLSKKFIADAYRHPIQTLPSAAIKVLHIRLPIPKSECVAQERRIIKNDPPFFKPKVNTVIRVT